ncbi:MAG: hypothetical protein ABI467_18465 [Kofleriaceae bacterium]
MQKLALGALCAALLACGSNSDNKVHIVTDAGSGSGSDATCNPLSQTGCNTGEKCTWVYDLVSADGTNILGHVGCAPDGDKVAHDQCTRNAAGAQGWDDCKAGTFCKAKRELVGPGGVGVCEQVCDNSGADATSACATDSACVAYHNIFEVSSMNVAGVCDYKCDPFADNDFLHTGSADPVRAGSACQPYEGCYGGPRDTQATSFSCAREYNTDMHNRDECTATSGNSLQAANPLSRVACSTASNGCSQGYMPLLYEDTSGSQVVTCTAMCKPKSCWGGTGHCGGNTSTASNLTGDPASPANQCQPSAIIGNAVTPAQPSADPAANNNLQCVFNWEFSFDKMGNFVTSPFNDTVGWCEDHSFYHYDKNGDKMITAADDEVEPRCDTMTDPGFGTGSADGSGNCTPANGCRGAGSFGCTSSTDSGLVTFQGMRRDPTVRIHPRLPYGYEP